MSRSILAAVLLLSMSALSCGGPCGKAEVWYLSEAAPSFSGVSDLGSYWVFENYDDPTERDTLFLAHRHMGFLEGSRDTRCDPHNRLIIEQQLVSGDASDTLNVSIWAYRQWDDMSLHGTYKGVQLWSSLYYNKELYRFQNMSEPLHVHQVLVIKDKTYYQVFSVTYDRYLESHTYWFAKEVGLIQFEHHVKATDVTRRYWCSAYHRA